MTPYRRHTPGEPAVTQTHPTGSPLDGWVFRTVSPRRHVPDDGGPVPSTSREPRTPPVIRVILPVWPVPSGHKFADSIATTSVDAVPATPAWLINEPAGTWAAFNWPRIMWLPTMVAVTAWPMCCDRQTALEVWPPARHTSWIMFPMIVTPTES